MMPPENPMIIPWYSPINSHEILLNPMKTHSIPLFVHISHRYSHDIPMIFPWYSPINNIPIMIFPWYSPMNSHEILLNPIISPGAAPGFSIREGDVVPPKIIAVEATVGPPGEAPGEGTSWGNMAWSWPDGPLRCPIGYVTKKRYGFWGCFFIYFTLW